MHVLRSLPDRRVGEALQFVTVEHHHPTPSLSQTFEDVEEEPVAEVPSKEKDGKGGRRFTQAVRDVSCFIDSF